MNDLNFKLERLIAELTDYKKYKEILMDTCQKMIDSYQLKLDMYNKDIKEKELFIKCQINALLEQNESELKETKTELNYKTPSAKFYFKKSSFSMKLKNDFNENEIPDDFIKTIRKVDWNEYKKTLKIVEDKDYVINEDGEIIESVEIVKKPKSELNIKYL